MLNRDDSQEHQGVKKNPAYVRNYKAFAQDEVVATEHGDRNLVEVNAGHDTVELGNYIIKVVEGDECERVHQHIEARVLACAQNGIHEAYVDTDCHLRKQL